MKAVIQRVLDASVAVEGKTISSIGQGLLVLVGIDRNDGPADSTTIIKKILSAKLFDDEDGNLWKKSVKEINGEVLCVSQFTLLAQFKGAKPDFHESMSTIPGKAHYTSFMEEIRKAYDTTKIQEGQFGAMMAVSLTNDGPTTILLNSRESRSSQPSSRIQTPGGSSTPITSSTTTRTPNDSDKAEESRKKAKELKLLKATKKAAFEANKAKNEGKRERAKKEKRADAAAAAGGQTDKLDGQESQNRGTRQETPGESGEQVVVEGDQSWVEKKLQEMRLGQNEKTE